MISLFMQYALLAERIPYVSLCHLPTPVQKLDNIGRHLHLDKLYIKRDDVSGELYGGNKPRKLEFVLGDALNSGIKEVMTFGGAGSNHALATAIYARQVGLKSISMLMPQPNAQYVRNNLLMSHCCGAELHSCGVGLESIVNMPRVYMATMYQLLKSRVIKGYLPRIIPAGGSSPVGVIGYVNAAFELKEQIKTGEIPEPEYIYVACGTMGTAAGLMLGLKAAGLKSRLVAVRVTSEKFVNVAGMLRLINSTNSLLHSVDSSFPIFNFTEFDIDIRHDYFGERYAVFTEDGMEAVSLMKELEDIKLDGTYTGKTFAAIIHDAKNGSLNGKTVLFWNTLNSRDFSGEIASIDFHMLPRAFHRYFEEELQYIYSSL